MASLFLRQRREMLIGMGIVGSGLYLFWGNLHRRQAVKEARDPEEPANVPSWQHRLAQAADGPKAAEPGESLALRSKDGDFKPEIKQLDTDGKGISSMATHLGYPSEEQRKNAGGPGQVAQKSDEHHNILPQHQVGPKDGSIYTKSAEYKDSYAKSSKQPGNSDPQQGEKAS